VLEFSILFLILKYFDISSKRLEQLSEIKFLSEKNENLKNAIISAQSLEGTEKDIKEKIENDYKNLIIQIIENSNIQHISKDKDESQVLQLLDELINDFKEQTNLKKIESLERELLNNLDENSYSELIRLKNQLNRD